jgi:DME family drug/metabolite transporter
VAIATLVTICSAPVLVCLFSAVLLRERLTKAAGAALVSALIGTVLLIGVGQRGVGAQASSAWSGILLSLAAACCFAAFILVSRLLAGRYPPLLAITIAVSIGAFLLLAAAAITIGVTVRYPWPAWGLFLYLGLFPTALGFALFYQGVQHTTASDASIASLVEPLTSTLLAVVIFGEHLGALGLLGAALLIGAIVLLYRIGSTRSG